MSQGRYSFVSRTLINELVLWVNLSLKLLCNEILHVLSMVFATRSVFWRVSFARDTNIILNSSKLVRSNKNNI